MQETTGTLNLKIAQLQRRLNVLRHQQLLSLSYPDHQAALVREMLKVQRQVQQLVQDREELEQHVTQLYDFSEVTDGQESFYAFG